MIDAGLGPGVLTLLFFALMVIILFSGLPLAFSLGGASVAFALMFWSSSSLYMFSSNVIGLMQNIVLAAVPLFIFMGTVMQRTGIGEDMYELVYRTLGRIKGGLAIGTVLICTVFAAMAGASAPATVTMGLVAFPSMLKRKYSFEMALGSIAAGGALGILIPPSVPLILYAMMTGTSVGKLFIGGIVPGLMLCLMFSLYIGIRCALNPRLGPALTKDMLKREKTEKRSFLGSSRVLGLPMLLILAVLGSIYAGVATPTEASAIGALGALVVAAINHRITRNSLKEANMEGLKLTVMILWIALGGCWLSSVYQAIGASKFVAEFMIGSELGRWGILILMQLTFFLLGCLMESTGIIFVTMPIYFPVIEQLGFDPVWFGVLFIINMEMAYLTPPFGVNLFYLRALAPKDVSMWQIYKAAMPFILIQFVALVLCMVFPQIITWLPGLMMR